jgi:uncharacterized membrane protein YedE/YeeE
MSPAIPFLVIWALGLALVALAGFGVGGALGRLPFVREKKRALLVYLGIVAVCVLPSALEFVIPVEMRTPMVMIDCWLMVVMWAITAVTPVVVAVFIRDGLAARRRQQMDPDLCYVCRYCLIGNVSGVCPECGTKLTVEQCDYIQEETRFRKAIEPLVPLE